MAYRGNTLNDDVTDGSAQPEISTTSVKRKLLAFAGSENQLEGRVALVETKPWHMRVKKTCIYVVDMRHGMVHFQHHVTGQKTVGN
jgi:hypothetical protein